MRGKEESVQNKKKLKRLQISALHFHFRPEWHKPSLLLQEILPSPHDEKNQNQKYNDSIIIWMEA